MTRPMKSLLFVLFILICIFLIKAYQERCRIYIDNTLKAYGDIQRLSIAVDTYNQDMGEFPRLLNELIPKYIKQVPIEMWGREYIYEINDNGSFKIYSLGLDGVTGGKGASLDIYRDTEPAGITQGILKPIYGCRLE